MSRYYRHGNNIVAVATTCTDAQCILDKCKFPHCSVGYQPFTSTRDADRYEGALKLLGHTVTREPF